MCGGGADGAGAGLVVLVEVLVIGTGGEVLVGGALLGTCDNSPWLKATQPK